MLKASGVDIIAQVMPTILKFVYFGIAILVSAYGAQSMWVLTSERLTRVCITYYNSTDATYTHFPYRLFVYAMYVQS